MLQRRIGRKNETVFLFCVRCNVQLLLVEKRELYCPKCHESTKKSGEKPEMILHCTECDNPLSAVNPEGSGYCEHCGFHPSMQDTYFQGLCIHDECFNLVTKGSWCNEHKQKEP